MAAAPVSYALKQIRCGDKETLDLCRQEASVHRKLCGSQGHPNIMPLLGLAIMDDKNNPNARVCYMLFPKMKHLNA